MPPHDAEYRDRAASGVHRALQARRLVAVAGQHRPVAHRVHQVPGRPGPRARRPLARCPRLGAGSMTALRSLLFNAFFYGWTALCVVIGLPLLLGPRSGIYYLGRFWAHPILAALECLAGLRHGVRGRRSEGYTSELQSLMRISYAVFCLKKTKQKHMK